MFNDVQTRRRLAGGTSMSTGASHMYIDMCLSDLVNAIHIIVHITSQLGKEGQKSERHSTTGVPHSP